MEERPATEAGIDRRGDLRWTFALSALAALAGLIALRFDVAIAKLVQGDGLPGDVRRVFGLAEIFAHGVGVVIIAWCIWHLAPHRRRCLPRLLACAFGPGLVANLLKLSFSRLRPTYFDEAWPQSISETWIAPFPAVFDARNEFGIYFASSFPSGHAATAFGLAIGLSWLFPAGRVPFFTLAVMASLQRIVGNAHWLSDTLFGLSLAVLIAGSLAANWRGTRWLARWESRQRGGIDEGTRSEA